MFDFPKQAELNRVLPKSKVYEFARPTRPVRDRFVRQIEEIQVFGIALKTRELTGAALRSAAARRFRMRASIAAQWFR